MARLKLSRKLDEATDPDQIRFWQEKVRFYSRALEGRCKRCGRELDDPTSVERGYGPECVRLVERVAS